VLRDQTDHLPNIISASRRTDIPAFFASWFEKRLSEGSVIVRNPYNLNQKKLVSLKTDDVFCFVFWTKNPAPLLDFYNHIIKYPHYFLITITGYGNDIEPNVPNKEFIISAIKKIYNYGIGSYAIVWRYDPIIITDHFSFQWHYHNFETIASALSSYVDTCIISFFDIYNPKLNAWDPLQNIPMCEINSFSENLAAIAKKYGITLQTCSELLDLDNVAIQHGACIDINRIALVRLQQGFENKNESVHESIKSMYQVCKYEVFRNGRDKKNESLYQVKNDSVLYEKIKKDKNQRNNCLCVKSIDIGAYYTCGHGCKYCYAKGKLKPFPQHEDSPCLGINQNHTICH